MLVAGRQGRCSWGPPFCGSRCPAPRTCPPPQSGPSSPPGTRLSKEEGVSCSESVRKAVEGGSVGLGPHRGEALAPAARGPAGSAAAGAGPSRVSFGFPSFRLKLGFAFLCFVCISFNVVKVALQASPRRPERGGPAPRVCLKLMYIGVVCRELTCEQRRHQRSRLLCSLHSSIL